MLYADNWFNAIILRQTQMMRVNPTLLDFFRTRLDAVKAIHVPKQSKSILGVFERGFRA